MADLGHYWSGDLGWSPGGDLLLATGSEATRQRILRRLMTVAGSYLWHLGYGAGLPTRIGEVLDLAALEGVARRQMLAEAGIARDPLPAVTVTPVVGGAAISIRYADAATGQPVALGFDLTQ